MHEALKSENFQWLTPFVCFGLGYLLMYSWYTPKVQIVPSLIGKSLPHAYITAYQDDITYKISHITRRSDLPNGCIVHQFPIAGQSIRSNHPVTITVNVHPEPKKIPSVIGMNIKQATDILSENNITFDTVLIPSSWLPSHVLAQSPEPQTPLSSRAVLYISDMPTKHVLWPNFIGLTIQQARELASTYSMPIGIVHDQSSTHYTEQSIVQAQRPLPKTIIEWKKDTVPITTFYIKTESQTQT